MSSSSTKHKPMVDRFNERLVAARADRILEPSPSKLAKAPDVVIEGPDVELEAALERVERGELARAYRTGNGALVITHVADPARSPAAPAIQNGG